MLREGRAFSLTEALEKFKQEADEICALMEEMSSVVVKNYDPEYWEEYWECQMMKDTWDGL